MVYNHLLILFYSKYEHKYVNRNISILCQHVIQIIISFEPTLHAEYAVHVNLNECVHL